MKDHCKNLFTSFKEIFQTIKEQEVFENLESGLKNLDYNLVISVFDIENKMSIFENEIASADFTQKHIRWKDHESFTGECDVHKHLDEVIINVFRQETVAHTPNILKIRKSWGYDEYDVDGNYVDEKIITGQVEPLLIGDDFVIGLSLIPGSDGLDFYHRNHHLERREEESSLFDEIAYEHFNPVFGLKNDIFLCNNHLLYRFIRDSASGEYTQRHEIDVREIFKNLNLYPYDVVEDIISGMHITVMPNGSLFLNIVELDDTHNKIIYLRYNSEQDTYEYGDFLNLGTPAAWEDTKDVTTPIKILNENKIITFYDNKSCGIFIFEYKNGKWERTSEYRINEYISKDDVKVVNENQVLIKEGAGLYALNLTTGKKYLHKNEDTTLVLSSLKLDFKAHSGFNADTMDENEVDIREFYMLDNGNILVTFEVPLKDDILRRKELLSIIYSR